MQVEDEMHFICNCSANEDERKELYKSMKNFVPNFTLLEDSENFITILNPENTEMSYIIGKYIFNCLYIRNVLCKT